MSNWIPMIVISLLMWAGGIWWGVRDRRLPDRIADCATLTVILWVMWAWLGPRLL